MMKPSAASRPLPAAATEPPDVTGKRIAAQARTWIGVPFRHAGRNRMGVDCMGLLAVVAAELGLTTYDRTDYSPVVNPDVLNAELDKFCAPASGEPKPGDVLTFRTENGSEKSAQHVGIVTRIDEKGTIWFVHAFEVLGKVVEDPLRMTWAERLVRVLRWRQEK
jgi:cell wall-associated NlpC family hydrolase